MAMEVDELAAAGRLQAFDALLQQLRTEYSRVEAEKLDLLCRAMPVAGPSIAARVETNNLLSGAAPVARPSAAGKADDVGVAGKFASDGQQKEVQSEQKEEVEECVPSPTSKVSLRWQDVPEVCSDSDSNGEQNPKDSSVEQRGSHLSANSQDLRDAYSGASSNPSGARSQTLGFSRATRIIEDSKLEMSKRPSVIQEGFVHYGRDVARLVVKSTVFEYAIIIAILLNAVTLGLQSQIELSGPAPRWLTLVESIFLSIYLLEFTLLVLARGLSNLRDNWFIFDTVLVAIGCAYAWGFEAPAAPASDGASGDTSDSGGGPLQQALLLRTLRLLRVLRAMRTAPFLKEAWRLVHGLLQSARMMLSTSALLFLFMYIFACVGLEVITRDAGLSDTPDFETRFGSLLSIMLTLLQFVTMDNASEIYVPLVTKRPVLILYFLSIILIISIALMNLVTAVIVTGALARNQEDEDLHHKDQRGRVKKLMPVFQDIFARIDTKRVGSVTLDQIEAMIHDLPSACRQALEYFEFESVMELFEVLDADGSGELDQEEFVEGLVSLSLASHDGVPREVHLLMKLMRTSKRSFRQIADCLASLSSAVQKTPGDRTSFVSAANETLATLARRPLPLLPAEKAHDIEHV